MSLAKSGDSFAQFTSMGGKRFARYFPECLRMSHFLCEVDTGTRRADVILLVELIEEIDAAVGPRGRSAFLAETARAELRRWRLLKFLSSEQPLWKDEDHPELANGTEAWVRSLREGRGERLGKIEQHRWDTEDAEP